MGIDKSLMAVFRIVAAMLAADRVIVPEEDRWFDWLMDRYEATPEQRARLEKDLMNPPNAVELFKEVTRADDRAQLLKWLRLVMNVDGKVSGSERDLYGQMAALESQLRPIKTENVEAYADSLIKYVDRTVFWKRIGAVAEVFSRPVPWYRRFGSWGW